MSYDSSSPPSRSTPVSSSTTVPAQPLPQTTPTSNTNNNLDDSPSLPSISLPTSTTYDPFFPPFDDGCSIYPTNNNNIKKFDPTIYPNSFATHFPSAGVPYPFYSDAATSYFSTQARTYSDYLCQPSYRPSTTTTVEVAAAVPKEDKKKDNEFDDDDWESWS